MKLKARPFCIQTHNLEATEMLSDVRVVYCFHGNIAWHTEALSKAQMNE